METNAGIQEANFTLLHKGAVLWTAVIFVAKKTAFGGCKKNQFDSLLFIARGLFLSSFCSMIQFFALIIRKGASFLPTNKCPKFYSNIVNSLLGLSPIKFWIATINNFKWHFDWRAEKWMKIWYKKEASFFEHCLLQISLKHPGLIFVHLMTKQTCLTFGKATAKWRKTQLQIYYLLQCFQLKRVLFIRAISFLDCNLILQYAFENKNLICILS